MLGALPNLAEEEAEDADVEQDAAPDELLAPEELARLGAPGVLAAIEACPTAEEEDRHADIREDAEQDRKRTRLHSSHACASRMQSAAVKNKKHTTTRKA